MYDMSDRDWAMIEHQVMMKLHHKSWNHVTWRYCWKCKTIRPPRTHHCSKCERCTIRMDHHCYWVGNCVGLYNHKVFLTFCIHSTAAAIIEPFFMAYQYPIWDTERFDWWSGEGIATMWCIAFIVLIGGLCAQQFMSISVNSSFLEEYDLLEANPF